MKWSFIDRPFGGCIISDILTSRIIVLLPPFTPKQGGQEQVRVIAQAIVLAHNAEV